MKGKASELWQAVAVGELPEHYWWQVQHQLMVARAKKAELFVFDGEDGILHEVTPKPDAWPRIRDAWDQFFVFLGTDTPPPLTERDTRLRDDEDWKVAAQAYISAKTAADNAGTVLEAAKEKLVSLASHDKEQGFDVTVTRYWKAGSVDYKKIPELKGVDLEKYRGPERKEVRITVSR